MTKTEALHLIDEHKNKMINPVDMLPWTWLRVIIYQIPDADWERYVKDAIVILSQ
jgi:hypothetical protein